MKEDLLTGHSNSEGHSDVAISRQTLHVYQSRFCEKFMQVT